MKKFIFIVAIIILSAFLSYKFMFLLRNKASIFNDNNISYISRVDGKSFEIYKYGKWEKSFVKGVNIGAAKPGAFPGEFSITKNDYIRWFKKISAMNVDSIRVYTILSPKFYDALYEYNQTTIKPLYLFQGVWINENDISEFENAFNPQIYNGFIQDIKTVTDIIHGNAKLSPKRGYASGVYTKDISPYVMGWILGIEWDPSFVQNTNKLNEKVTSFDGKYIYAKDASAFEVFLSEAADYAISYETSKYKMQRPVSFTNWVTTDLLKHPNEPLSNEDIVEVNTEHIQKKDTFKAGLFASYHIYPYYPDSMNYQHDYITYKDKSGKTNTFEAYLKDLIKEHKVPVLVAEFGVPASRGIAHKSIYTGYNQGNIDEKSQGKMEAEMLQSIHDVGYAGALVFSWQDEWFKRTWNTMDLDLVDRRPYWSNPQSVEQEFGILAFDPGKDKSICYVDGEISDWKKDKPLINTPDMKLYAKSDEKYLYIMGDIKGFNLENDKILIPIDVTPNSGNLKYNDYNVEFKKQTDMVIVIGNEASSRIVTDAYYDVFNFIYSKQLRMLSENMEYEKVNSGIFNPIYLCLNKSLYLPQDKKSLPFEKFETGKLILGDGNPAHSNYNSLTDYSVNKDKIEIRIPWQLLNVMDPSSKMVMDDFYQKNKISSIKINGIYLSGILIRNNIASINTNMEFYSWKEWETPIYHERLKASYYILKNAFKAIEGK